ncbi:protoporphyrinogen oxidase HemJ [Plastoroseomonas arctica]|uniref:Protoporphyrinogen IX oxidase n=1 Tax=Plastoroseomonas arctica TaxID=1509237 RepID=A0AAF1K0Y1_9PROT|nr:protoporphyrinogen oxidase HemJ [Plastoroseomonas arctica]MBR0657008.1 protoporphyrinogen oxidase HemJ [Plastoroseomonas arctica]
MPLIDALAPYYLWTKSLHLIAVFAWMAGLFYLPRLYVYHSQVAAGTPQSDLFITMERRLLRAIMNPAMIAAWILGIVLILTPGAVDWHAGWWHTKLLGVLAMTAFHGHLAVARKAFADGNRPHTERYWRAMNEAPTLLLVLIVVMVIVKPF